MGPNRPNPGFRARIRPWEPGSPDLGFPGPGSPDLGFPGLPGSQKPKMALLAHMPKTGPKWAYFGPFLGPFGPKPLQEQEWP